MSTETLRRTIHPEIRIIDETEGLSEYIASDETVDSYREVIRADGWRFDFFKKNAPFVDSHNYESITNLLGTVVDFSVSNGRLIETVKWAIDVPENKAAQLGWKMAQSGHLKAVSVGFRPVKAVSQGQGDFEAECLELGIDSRSVRTIYLEQQQLELSAVILGANPQAVALAYKAGIIDESDLELFASSRTALYGRQFRELGSFDSASAQDFLDSLEAIVYHL